MGDNQPRRARRLAVTVAVVLLGALVAVVAVRATDDEDRLADGVGLLADDSRFGTAAEAGESFARVSGHLEHAGVECRREHGEVPRCQALLAGSAYAQVVAVEVLRCSRPVVYGVRQELLSHVRTLRSLPRAARAAPEIPAVPRC